MSAAMDAPPPIRCVPIPSTQLPLHGAQTPTIAPDDPVAAIAKATASSSCWTVSSGSGASHLSGGVEDDMLIDGAAGETEHESERGDHRGSGPPSNGSCRHLTPR